LKEDEKEGNQAEEIARSLFNEGRGGAPAPVRREHWEKLTEGERKKLWVRREELAKGDKFLDDARGDSAQEEGGRKSHGEKMGNVTPRYRSIRGKRGGSLRRQRILIERAERSEG